MIETNSLEIFKSNIYTKYDIGYVSDNAYLSIVATNKCQRNCFYCINSHTDRSLFLPLEKAVANIKKLVEKYKIKEAIILGGEPFLYENLLTLIYKLKNETKLKHIRLSTNGLELKNNIELNFKLGLSGLTSINISYHNDKNFMAIEELYGIVNCLKKSNSDLKIRINTNVWQGNNDSISALLSLIKRLYFVDEIRISNIIFKDGFSVNTKNTKHKHLILSDTKYKKLFENFVNSFKQVTVFNNFETLGFVQYSLIPIKPLVIVNWNIQSNVSKQIIENFDRKINTFKCLVNGEISLSWNSNHIIELA